MAIKAESWALAICEALDIDPSMIARIEIVLEAYDKVYLHIEADGRNSDAVIARLKEAGKEVHRITVRDADTEKKTFGDEIAEAKMRREKFKSAERT